MMTRREPGVTRDGDLAPITAENWTVTCARCIPSTGTGEG
jgi:hypothetical protein